LENIFVIVAVRVRHSSREILYTDPGQSERARATSLGLSRERPVKGVYKRCLYHRGALFWLSGGYTNDFSAIEENCYYDHYRAPEKKRVILRAVRV
jgi:hypothetical protein